MRNPFERRLWQSFWRRFKLGQFQEPEYETEKITYTLNYLPDFIIRLFDGRTIYIEAKGWLRPEDKTKLLAVKRDHPDKDIRIIFQSKNKKQERWAERHKFIYAIGSAPKEWFV